MAMMSELDALLTELSEHSRGVMEAVKGIRELLSASDAEDTAEAAPKKKPFTLEDGGTNWRVSIFGFGIKTDSSDVYV